MPGTTRGGNSEWRGKVEGFFRGMEQIGGLLICFLKASTGSLDDEFG